MLVCESVCECIYVGGRDGIAIRTMRYNKNEVLMSVLTKKSVNKY